jgi:hypothetical protein
VKLAAPAALLLVLAALIGGCGGGGSTTVIEKTVTEKVPADEGGGTGGEGEAAEGEAETAEGKGAREKGREGATGDAGQGNHPEDKIEEPTAVVHLQSFRSPSGNIGCVMFEGGARCDIRKREWSTPARPPGCPEQVDFGQGLSVDHTGKASFVCAGDTALDPTATPLAYGEASEVGGTQCISRSEGITCANHSAHGFFISIQSYKTF